jgi:L-threonylcarbamoyladenylate synthase
MQTEIVSTVQNKVRAIAAAVEVLRERGLVALPSETVYGLAGDALEPEAVIKIFEAKERPFFDPLIVHVPNRDWVDELVKWESGAREIIDELMKRFWPGPLTLLLPRTDRVPDLVTAGLIEVAVRQPSHPIFAEVLSAFGKPLAAPSANRFGRVSPTTASHVLTELEGRIPLILDAGSTFVGVESTVIRATERGIEILRPGPVTHEQLGELAPIIDRSSSTQIEAPGQTESHYAPTKPVRILETLDSSADYTHSGHLCWGIPKFKDRFALVHSLSETRNLYEAAQRLFALLREFDGAPIDIIFVDPVPETGIGRAIMNRLRRSAALRPGR